MFSLPLPLTLIVLYIRVGGIFINELSNFLCRFTCQANPMHFMGLILGVGL